MKDGRHAFYCLSIAGQECSCDPWHKPEIPRSRGSDPITSHEAEAHIRSTGKLGKLQDLVLDLLRQNPGSTARELDSRFILDGVAHRRLIELERRGLVVRGEARTSKWHERRAITWRAK
jgi:hypothetical protein